VSDEPWVSVLLDHELSNAFGSDFVFRASRSIRPGEDFQASIITAVRNSSALLAVIGPRWTGARRVDGRRAIDDPVDWVRREIAQAFAFNIRVIPLLIGDAPIPRADELPDEIARLATFQFLRLRYHDSESDLARIIDELRKVVPWKARKVTLPRVAASDAIGEVSVWTSSDQGERVRDAMLELMELVGFETVDQAYPAFGSWFQRIFVRQPGLDAQDKIAQLAEKVERAAELKYIGAPRSENDEREARAIAQLVDALANTDEAVIRTSSVLLIKVDGRILSWVLTENELLILNANPQLMRSPIDILEALPNLRRIVDWNVEAQVSDPPTEAGPLA
jgi:hypothetical protein